MDSLLQLLPFQSISNIILIDNHKRDDIISWFPLHPISHHKSFQKISFCSVNVCRLVQKMIENGTNDWNVGLLNGCEYGNIQLVKCMVEHGANNLKPAIKLALVNGHKEIFTYLVDYDNHIQHDYHNPYNNMEIASIIMNHQNQYAFDLSDAISSRNIELITSLIEKGEIMLNKHMIQACERGDKEIAEFIIAQSPDHICENAWSQFLLGACESSNFELIKMIGKHLMGSPNLNMSLLRACVVGNIEVVNYLIDLGANCLNCALYTACQYGHMEVIKLLINKGANDWNAGLEEAGYGLYYACDDLPYEFVEVNGCLQLRYIHEEIMEMMINNGATDLNSALLYSCRQGFERVAQMLIEKGASNLDECFNRACFVGNLKLAKYLIGKGVKNLNNGFIQSFMGENKQLIRFLIDHGANCWNDGLKSACYFGYMDIVELMIEKGANCWNDGLYKACCNGNIQIIKLMIEKGANDFNCGFIGACEHGKINIVRLMIEKGANEIDRGIAVANNEGEYDAINLLKKFKETGQLTI